MVLNMLASYWIARIKKETEAKSNYRIAKLLGVEAVSIKQMETGRTKTTSDDVALRIAELLGEKPMTVIADQAMERAKREETKEFWKRYAGNAQALFLSLLGLFSGLVCILCKIRADIDYGKKLTYRQAVIQ